MVFCKFILSLEAELGSNKEFQGTEQLPYYTYDLVGADWTATFVVVDSDCFLSSYQKVLISQQLVKIPIH